MTNQEAFDKVVTHLLTQNQRAYDEEEDTCRYRWGPLSCAVGCLIPDDQYNRGMEGQSVHGLVRAEVCPAPAVLGGLDLSLLGDLQHIHDNIMVEEWGEYLKDLASENNLEYKGVAA